MKTNRYLILIAVIIRTIVVGQTPISQCGFDNYYQDLINANPQFVSQINDFRSTVSAFRSTEVELADQEIYIPVVFHVVYNSFIPEQNISDAQIENQLAILNSCFANSVNNPNSVDTKIRFCFARRDPGNLATTGIVRYQSAYEKWLIKPGSATDERNTLTSVGYWDKTKYLNIWIANIKEEKVINNEIQLVDLLGQSNIAGYTNPFSADGIIINYKYVGAIGTANIPNYNLGKTLVHEVGHWLGLFHTFHNSFQTTCANEACNIDGDKICDTPPVYNPAYNDPFWATDNTKRKDCSEAIISAENYMEYNFDQHTKFFTNNQKSVMRAALATYRNYIYSNSINNINSLAIECSPPSNGTNPQHYSNCTSGYYPDQWLRMNGNDNPYIDLCEGVKPILNLQTPDKCMLLPAQKIIIKCDGNPGLHDGNCPTSSTTCTKLCELVGACQCYSYSRVFFFSVWTGCDDNFNCLTEIQKWQNVGTGAINANIDIESMLNINFNQLHMINGNQRKKYIIKFAIFDTQGNWRSGQKYITFIPSVRTFPDQFPNGFATGNQKASDQIIFTANCIIPTNSYYGAANQISLKDETHTNGLIESHLKIDNYVCSNLTQRILNEETKPRKNNNQNLEGIVVDELNNYFKKEKINDRFNQTTQLKVLPNPSNGKYNIIGLQNEDYSVSIYNSLGTLIKILKVSNNNSGVDITGIDTGLYLFIIETPNGVRESIRVVKN